MRPVWNIHLDDDGPEPTLTLPIRLRASELYARIASWAIENDREWVSALAIHPNDGTTYYFPNEAAA